MVRNPESEGYDEEYFGESQPKTGKPDSYNTQDSSFNNDCNSPSPNKNKPPTKTRRIYNPNISTT